MRAEARTPGKISAPIAQKNHASVSAPRAVDSSINLLYPPPDLACVPTSLFTASRGTERKYAIRPIPMQEISARIEKDLAARICYFCS
jgi:hypothetical protein